MPFVTMDVGPSWSHFGLGPGLIDLNVRLIASLISIGDYEQVFRRTGVRFKPNGQLGRDKLPLFIALDPKVKWKVTLGKLLAAKIPTQGFSVEIPRAYLDPAFEIKHLAVVTARFDWKWKGSGTPSPTDISTAFQDAIAKLIKTAGVLHVSVPYPLQPTLKESFDDIAMPPNRTVNGQLLDGNKIIIGIIDDGCAFAHRHFLIPNTNQSRIRYMWDQARTTAGGGWQLPGPFVGGMPSFGGMEITQQGINAAIAGCVRPNSTIDEDKVYERLKYEVDLRSHGTHVMDIAAGNGKSLMGSEGVARAADIIFVQLPTDLVEEGGPMLETCILEGITYIFHRANALGLASGLGKAVPAVVNVSYGGYSGPHDGTSDIAVGIDDMLNGYTNRAVVISAGNGFDADCHARQTVVPGATRTLNWTLAPMDATANQLEVYYSSAAKLQLSLQPPLSLPLPPVRLGQSKVLRRSSDGQAIGWIDHHVTATLATNVIRIHLNLTESEDTSPITGNNATGPMPAPTAPAPSGTWTVALSHAPLQAGAAPAVAVPFDAWIARDDVRVRSRRRRQQSRFDPVDAEPRGTVADIATGKYSICVGAHNAVTGEMARYSAAGPTRDGRALPHVTAPAEETGRGGGVLSASSRRSQPSRFNGTSAAAPQVAGLVALLLQYLRDRNRGPLTPQAIRDRIVKGAVQGGLLPPPPIRKVAFNRHDDVNPKRLPGKKQRIHFSRVKGKGKINVPKTFT